jgi:glycopeptide antibiotics resistance protein
MSSARQKPAGDRRRMWPLWGLIGYGLIVAIIVFTPVSYGTVIDTIGGWLRDGLNLTGFGSGWIEFAANILMFVPLGFLLTLLFRRPWHGVLLALVLSAGVEIAQLAIPSRQASLRDVVANVLGASLGALLAWIIVRRRRRVAESGAPSRS